MALVHSFSVLRSHYGNKLFGPQTGRILLNRMIHTRQYTSPTSEKSKFRRFYDQYGKLGIGVYLGISLVSVSSIYTAIQMGFDVNALLKRFNLNDNSLVSKAGPFAVAYGIHKLLAPARLLLAFVLTPVIKRRFFLNK
jgi:hypothetical protein